MDQAHIDLAEDVSSIALCKLDVNFRIAPF
jgi:hypothetical protein